MKTPIALNAKILHQVKRIQAGEHPSDDRQMFSAFKERDAECELSGNLFTGTQG